MNKVFAKEINSFILVYLNEILIYSRSIGEHWGHLKIALDRLRPAKLYVRLHKCEFLKDNVDYLGFEVSKDGIHASSDKVKAVLDWSRPQSVHDIRSFWGLDSYYRNFIKRFSQLAKPLTDMMWDKTMWRWGDSKAKCFAALNVALATGPVLRLPGFDKQFAATTDASAVAVGAILE